MANLKELFQYQNVLTNWKNDVISKLKRESYITQTKETHEYSKYNPEKKDEIIEVNEEFKKNNPTAKQLIEFLFAIVSEKEKITNAIANAKKALEINIDSEIELNKTRQEVGRLMKYMSQIANAEEYTKKGTDYKFNGEGNQVPYHYNIKSVTTIDFDRKVTKKRFEEFMSEADKISLEIEKANLNTNVEVDMKWTIHETLEDALVEFK